jgi:hypothetical protein
MAPSPCHSHAEPACSGGSKRPNRYLTNPASCVTYQGNDPDPGDLGWRIRRRWRVIYYGYRNAAGLPLWQGARDFERLMAGILARLSRGFEPIAPFSLSRPVQPDQPQLDPRSERFQQESCRIFRTPRLDRRGRED